MWGDIPNNPTVTKFCVWVPLPDVINCARFYLYRPNSFWDRTLSSHWLERWLTFTTARALLSSAVMMTTTTIMMMIMHFIPGFATADLICSWIITVLVQAQIMNSLTSASTLASAVCMFVESLELESSFLICRYIFRNYRSSRISRSSGQGQGHCSKGH